MIYDEIKKITGAFSLAASGDRDGALDVKRLHRVRKRVLRIVLLVGLVLLLFHRSSWPVNSVMHQALTRMGVLLLAIAIAGRTWVWAHLGRRRHSQFVFDGPYSVVRHPLYAFSILGAVGVAAQAGSIIMMCLLSTAVWAVFNRVGHIEETDMASRFGESYRAYLSRTPRFIPRFSLWTGQEVASIEYRPLLKCLRDASLFALAVPTFIVIDWAQRTGVLPVLFGLP